MQDCVNMSLSVRKHGNITIHCWQSIGLTLFSFISGQTDSSCWQIIYDILSPSSGTEPTLLVHCQALYAVKNVDIKTKEEAGQELLSAIQEIYPELPTPIKVIPHFWRYGQVYKPYPGTPGFIELGSDPLVLAGGDSFMEMSNLQACARGAELMEGRIRKRFGVPVDSEK